MKIFIENNWTNPSALIMPFVFYKQRDQVVCFMEKKPANFI